MNVEYRRHDGGYEEIYTYADHLADSGVLCRGERDVVWRGFFYRVNWRQAKQWVRQGALIIKPDK